MSTTNVVFHGDHRVFRGYHFSAAGTDRYLMMKRCIMKYKKFSDRQRGAKAGTKKAKNTDLSRSEQLIRTHGSNVKAPSKILGRLLAVLADDEHQRKELEMLMRTDSSLTANVLKVANSAQFRGGNVVDIGAAMTRLGENEISRIAIR
ncbi:MAG: HDOD domain-containing protein, partial [Kofleriaceae bacterium]|nr:HDOD domain-containing protein [Kofleriaceae bacterium]